MAGPICRWVVGSSLRQSFKTPGRETLVFETCWRRVLSVLVFHVFLTCKYVFVKGVSGQLIYCTFVWNGDGILDLRELTKNSTSDIILK